MKLSHYSRRCGVAVFLIAVASAVGQGTFFNLGFENATIVRDTNSPYYPYAVFASNAIPRWTAYISDVPQQDIIYNNLSLGASWISIHDSNGLIPVIEGRYTMFLQQGFDGHTVS